MTTRNSVKRTFAGIAKTDENENQILIANETTDKVPQNIWLDNVTEATKGADKIICVTSLVTPEQNLQTLKPNATLDRFQPLPRILDTDASTSSIARLSQDAARAIMQEASPQEAMAETTILNLASTPSSPIISLKDQTDLPRQMTYEQIQMQPPKTTTAAVPLTQPFPRFPMSLLSTFSEISLISLKRLTICKQAINDIPWDSFDENEPVAVTIPPVVHFVQKTWSRFRDFVVAKGLYCGRTKLSAEQKAKLSRVKNWKRTVYHVAVGNQAALVKAIQRCNHLGYPMTEIGYEDPDIFPDIRPLKQLLKLNKIRDD